MTCIIGASGKKQSGKNDLCDNLEKWILEKLGKNSKTGKVYSCKTYSFADALKEKVCIEVMGLTKEQCYGTDEQKNSDTMYRWENLPREIRFQNKLGENRAPNGEIYEFIFPTGFMTAREIMQIVGTDIFRKYFDDSIWVNATFRSIEKDNPDFALISDVRFPSEVEGIAGRNGILFRLLRNVCEGDSHSSETALDNYEWNSIHNAYVIDNRNMSIEEKNVYVRDVMDVALNCQSMREICNGNT